jgi:membrane associated rhomboid family serine protease
MSERCPICGADLPDRNAAWLHFEEMHTGRSTSPAGPAATPRPPGGSGQPNVAQTAPAGGIWRQGYANGPATMVVLAITLAAWALDRGLHYGFGIEITHALGGNGQLYTDGQWWRLITPALVHFGPIHLAFNMAWLYQLGPAVERIMGRLGFVLTYVGTAIAGDVCSDLVYYHRTNFLSGGASGAIYGLGGVIVGAYAVAKWLERRRTGPPPPGQIVFNDQAVKSLALFFGAYLAVTYFVLPGVDTAGHFGGGLLGLGIGGAVALRHNRAAAASPRSPLS